MVRSRNRQWAHDTGALVARYTLVGSRAQKTLLEVNDASGFPPP